MNKICILVKIIIIFNLFNYNIIKIFKVKAKKLNEFF